MRRGNWGDNRQGFALPTVLIASVVMLIVLLSALTATSSISSSLKGQYITQVAREAALSGIEMAKTCLEANNEVSWVPDMPLKPNTDCSGVEEPSCPSTSDNAACYVFQNGNLRSTFRVITTAAVGGTPANIESKGIVREVRTTSGAVVHETTEIVKMDPKDGPSALKPSALTWKQISTGGSHTCAIASDNNAYCWGDNTYGQLGDGTTTQRNTPTAVNLNKTIRSISAESSHTCAIASDNKVYCWGRNNSGQLGDGTTTQRNTPTAVNLNKTIRSISVRSSSACAVTLDSDVYCWGWNGVGQFGNGTTNASTGVLNPATAASAGPLAGKGIREMSIAYNHACAIASDSNTYCWGGNFNGALGIGNTNSNYSTPTPALVNVGGKTARRLLGLGFGHSCIIASDNKVYCWGDNTYGQLGSGTSSNAYAPVSVAGVLASSTVRQIDSELFSTCAIASDNNAYCWGQNNYGQLGGGTSISSSNVPVAVVRTGILANKTIRQISVGGESTCAIASDNNAYCWGYNNRGQLGDGTTAQRNAPAAVKNVTALDPVTTNAIAVGDSHACAIASDNNAYCWGAGCAMEIDWDYLYEYGDVRYVISDCKTVLGSEAVDPSPTPIAVMGAGALADKTILSLSSSKSQTCALASDYRAYCWGLTSLLSAASYSALPAPAAGTRTFRTVEAGYNHACGIASDNKVYCWGNNTGSTASSPGGKLGRGLSGTSWTASAITVSQGDMPAGAMVRQLSVGAYHSCVIASDNNAYCWGDNMYWQTGSGNGDAKLVPTAVNRSGVLAGKTIKQISAGTYNTCVIASDDKAYCWGQGSTGANGNGTTTGYNEPVRVSQDLSFSSISVGYHACGITTEGKAYCWGNNGWGNLGNNSTTTSTVPVPVARGAMPKGATIRSIKASSVTNATCAIASDNNTYCWGNNNLGQLGNDTVDQSPIPTKVRPFPSRQSIFDTGHVY